MPHTARKRGESGFHHVVAKGDGGQVIFEGNADRQRFVSLMEEVLETHKLEVHAYCLMSNHVHMLLRDTDNLLSNYMKSLCEKYAAHFKWRTGRTGHIFKHPFWSEPVDGDSYYLQAMRYIHANPEPAGICRTEDYPWSSYHSYLVGGSFVKTEMALDMLGGIDQFRDFHKNRNTGTIPFPGSKLRGHLDPDELARVALGLIGKDALHGLRQMKPRERTPHITKLVDAGFTEREISRITGIGRSAIHRTIAETNAKT